jgi:Tfp pilus assembly protein PilO
MKKRENLFWEKKMRIILLLIVAAASIYAVYYFTYKDKSLNDLKKEVSEFKLETSKKSFNLESAKKETEDFFLPPLDFIEETYVQIKDKAVPTINQGVQEAGLDRKLKIVSLPISE